MRNPCTYCLERGRCTGMEGSCLSYMRYMDYKLAVSNKVVNTMAKAKESEEGLNNEAVQER